MDTVKLGCEQKRIPFSLHGPRWSMQSRFLIRCHLIDDQSPCTVKSDQRSWSGLSPFWIGGGDALPFKKWLSHGGQSALHFKVFIASESLPNNIWIDNWSVLLSPQVLIALTSCRLRRCLSMIIHLRHNETDSKWQHGTFPKQIIPAISLHFVQGETSLGRQSYFILFTISFR